MFEELKELIKLRTGNIQALEFSTQTTVTGIFNPRTLHFIGQLSESLTNDPMVREYPDLYQFAFWCRSSGLKVLQSNYNDNKLRKGRGIVLHFAPSNIPVHFAYLLVIGLLAGNKTIIRISSKVFDQAELLIHHLNALIADGFSDFFDRIIIIQYAHNKAITDYLSGISNARTTWGGNQTIQLIQQSVIKPGGIDISFANRHSICLINAAEYLNSKEKEKIAAGFYNDTYIYDQYSCSSPYLIIWSGEHKAIEAAQQIFWKNTAAIVKKKYHIQPAQILHKYETLAELAALKPISVTPFTENTIMRAQLMQLDETISSIECRNGLFLEYSCKDVSETAPLFDENLQTITYFGFDKKFLLDFVQRQQSSGNERIVKIGRALEFAVQWDGTDLIQALSKKITI